MPSTSFVAIGTMRPQWLDCATDYSDYTHPTIQGNENKFVTRLLETMTSDVRRCFPNKCEAFGSSCQIGPQSPIIVPNLEPSAAPIPSPTALPPTTNYSGWTQRVNLALPFHKANSHLDLMRLAILNASNVKVVTSVDRTIHKILLLPDAVKITKTMLTIKTNHRLPSHLPQFQGLPIFR